jgi:hypothetical protein
MKQRADLFNDALLSSAAMGSMDTLRMDGHGLDYNSIRSDAVSSIAKELTQLMSKTLQIQELFDMEHFYQYAKIRLQQGWPGVYGGTEIALRHSSLYREHMTTDARKVMEQALRGLYKTFSSDSPEMKAVYQHIRRIS